MADASTIETLDKTVSYALAGAYVDITENKSSEEVYNNFITNLGTLAFTPKQVVTSLYQVIVKESALGLFDVLLAKYPDQNDYIEYLRLNVLLSGSNLNGDDKYQIVLDYHKKYTPTKESLLTEVNFLIRANFRDPDRIREIFKTIKQMEETVNGTV